MRLKTLIRLWLWTTLLALAAFAVLAYYETVLKSATGFNMRDLQSMTTAYDYQRALAAWIARQHAAMAGFSLGFDYLFMPLYAMSFYFSGMIAREAFTLKRTVTRRVVDYLGFLPIIGAIADAIENALEFAQLTRTPTDAVAQWAHLATQVKFVCFFVGLALLIAAVAGWFTLRRPKKEDAD
ncbi:MAG: hypothetical protein JO294_13785 [Alphaproteobacteria bacterium]|nr:hypothetical protein [Alphaproteobacteria bacterium]